MTKWTWHSMVEKRVGIGTTMNMATPVGKGFTIFIGGMLLSELPKMSRNHGTSAENLKKGSFRVSEEGNCEVFLNPQNDVFIKLEAYGETYYLSGYDDEETRQVYEMLK